MTLVEYILLSFIIVLLVDLVRCEIKVKKLEKRAQRVDGDINTLHHNEGVLSSSLNELCKEMRKHEKNTKVIKRSIRAIPREEGEEESRNG
jgi:predicted Holliday junction resolvase-like endonuclease